VQVYEGLEVGKALVSEINLSNMDYLDLDDGRRMKRRGIDYKLESQAFYACDARIRSRKEEL
jgi:hypothetical protein